MDDGCYSLIEGDLAQANLDGILNDTITLISVK